MSKTINIGQPLFNNIEGHPFMLGPQGPYNTKEEAKSALISFYESINDIPDGQECIIAGVRFVWKDNDLYENLAVKVISENETDLNSYRTPGTYRFNSIRNNNFANLPINNNNPNASITGELVVYSSVEGTTTYRSIIGQVLFLSNAEGHETKIYTRSANKTSKDGGAIYEITWGDWQVCQGMKEVGVVNSYDSFIDNGMYSGVYNNNGVIETFIVITINDYTIKQHKSVSQLKYALNANTNKSELSIRVGGGQEFKWGEWKLYFDEENITAKITSLQNQLNALTKEVNNKIDTLVVNDLTTGGTDKALSAEMGKALNEELSETVKAEDTDEIVEGIEPNIVDKMRALENDHAKFKEETKEVIDNIKPIVINGDVINAPDEEDLTTDEDNRLRFKDRPALSGMGYVILRKNFVGGKNLLTQEMVDQPNTIYEIRYDFDLNSETVTLKEGCTLYFCGGKLDKGVLNGKYTNIKSISTSLPIFGENLSINNVIADEAYSEYFGDVSSDATTLIQKCLDVFYRCTLNEGKTYCISNSILLKYGRKLSGKPRSVIKTLNDGFSLFKLGSNSTLEHLYVDLDDKTQNVIHTDSELIGSTFHEYMKEAKPEESADSWKYMNYANIRVSDISVMSTAAPIEYTNNRQLYCFESCANGKGTGYWGIYFTNINVYGAGYDYVIVIDNSNSGQTWQTDQEWKNIKIRKAKNGILVTKSDTKGFPAENITFDHVSMQYYEDTNSYEDANGKIKYAHFIKFDAVNRANLRNCIDWDFPVGRTWHINPNRCQGVKIENQPLSGNNSPEIYLTETVNSAETFSPIVVNNYRSSAGAIQLLHSFVTTEELGSKMTHEIITRLPSGIYAISPEYSYRTFLGIDASIPIVMDFGYAYLKVEWWSLGRGILTLYTANSARGCPQSPIATLPYAVTSANLSKPIDDWMLTMPPMQAYESVDDFYNATHVSAGKTQGILATTTKGMLIHKSPQWFITNALGFTAAPIVGSTAKRPTDKLHTWEDAGFMYFDTTLNKPIWWTGSKWVDATGADV